MTSNSPTQTGNRPVECKSPVRTIGASYTVLPIWPPEPEAESFHVVDESEEKVDCRHDLTRRQVDNLSAASANHSSYFLNDVDVLPGLLSVTPDQPMNSIDLGNKYTVTTADRVLLINFVDCLIMFEP